MTKRMGVAAMFLVGCAVGGVSSQVVVPKASAQQAATLTKWEYKCQSQGNEFTETANALGAERWEMVGLGTYPSGNITFCFKRPKM